MATQIKNVIVFGDSLSDIGKKWTTKSGRAARLGNQMYVSKTGRFSDCRNWTDFMYEEAGGPSLVVSDAGQAYKNSLLHMQLTASSLVGLGIKSFSYVNYAEGGACGDTPREKAAFLGTFKQQVDAFKLECAKTPLIGPTLFLIWFGANDLYTANRPAAEMGVVAYEIAENQRTRLKLIAPDSKFIFVDMARPLTSVRYSMRLEAAKQKLKNALRGASIPLQSVGRVRGPIARPSSPWLLKGSEMDISIANNAHLATKELSALEAQVEEIKQLERGVLNFNVELARIARQHRDFVAEIGGCITEASIASLLEGNYGLKAGASATRATHMSAQQYSQTRAVTNISTIDQAHPTDEMYRLIWLEIYKQIKMSDCTFGNLAGGASPTLLSELAGPTQQTKDKFQSVMRQLRSRG